MRVQLNAQSQEQLFDVSNTASQLVMPSSTVPSLPLTEQPTALATQNTVISVPLVQSVVTSVRSNGECRLVSQEAKSDLFEDHLLPILDSGVQEHMPFTFHNIIYFRNMYVTYI